VAKRTYSEIKHPDKFAEALSNAWERVEPYALRVCLGAIGLLVLAGVWIALSRRGAARAEEPWAEHFEIARDFADAGAESADARDEQLATKMADLVAKYPAKPIAAITLLELTQWNFRRATTRRRDDAKAARGLFEDAANAAEQFIADFPDHRYLTLACFEAGKARLELGEYERAAQHFGQASQSLMRYLAVQAKWHRAFCLEKLGRADEARPIYETLRDDPTAGWCAEQAEFQLAQLGQQPSKKSPPEAVAPAPSSGVPAPSK